MKQFKEIILPSSILIGRGSTSNLIFLLKKSRDLTRDQVCRRKLLKPNYLMIYGSVSVAMASFAFWNMLEYAILKVILDDRRLKKKESQEQFQNLLKYAHVLVSLVHSLIGFMGSITAINLHLFSNLTLHDRVFGTPEPTVWVPVACSLGYFTWDLLTCIRRRSRPLYDPIFSVHAAVCLVGFIIGLVSNQILWHY